MTTTATKINDTEVLVVVDDNGTTTKTIYEIEALEKRILEIPKTLTGMELAYNDTVAALNQEQLNWEEVINQIS